MVPKLEVDRPLRKNEIMKDEPGLLDYVWACFLHDYDNAEDDGISLESTVETVSHKEYEYLKNNVLDMKRNKKKGKILSKQELKKSILIASLKRSTKLLAYSKKLDDARSSVAGKSKVSDSKDNSNEVIDRILEDRNNSLHDNLDIAPVDRHFEIQREGPPKMIFVGPQDDLGDIDDSVTKSPRHAIIDLTKASSVRNTSTRMSERELVVDLSKTLYIHHDVEGHENYLQIAKGNKQVELKAIQRKELTRKIALLRIRATKATMARVDN